MVFAVTFVAVFHMLPQAQAHDVEQHFRTSDAATRSDERPCGTDHRIAIRKNTVQIIANATSAGLFSLFIVMPSAYMSNGEPRNRHILTR